MTGKLTAEDFQLSARNDESRERYEKDFKRFTDWCRAFDFEKNHSGGYSPDSVAEYLAYLASKYKTSTVKRYMAEISAIHNEHGWKNPCEDPAVRRTMKGIIKVYGNDREPKRALTWQEIQAMVDRVDREVYPGKFKAACLLFGFASAMRRSELMGIKKANVFSVADDNGKVIALEILVHESKTGQFTRIVKKARKKKYCPVYALLELISAQDKIKRYRDSEWVFPSPRLYDQAMNAKSYASLVKHLAVEAGVINKDQEGEIGGHSTRRGCITHLAKNNHAAPAIMALSGHKDYKTMLDYIDQANKVESTPRAAE